MATLVPVARAGRRPPWQEWCGRDLPPELFAACQQARELSGQRKFDDALESYYEALRFDPTNLYLRTQIAGIQEQLWLHLDALETYYGALRLDGRNSAQRNARSRDALLGPAPDPASSLRLVAGRCPGSALPLRRRPRGGGADRRSVVQGRRSAVPAADARPEADPAGPRPRPRRTALACLHGAQAARPGRALRAGPGKGPVREWLETELGEPATAVSDRP
ncbi:Tetratricopeptide repeat-containing protein OS=Streptomyces microflavus OX=1919 GN=Smic_82410 PE=4 SV=1 [Streptomyces microflavus]